MNKLEKIAYELSDSFTDEHKKSVVRSSLQPNANWMDKVAAFHLLYGAPHEASPQEGLPTMDDARIDLRLGLIEEEFEELKEASRNRDIVEVADALSDIAYVVAGFALEAGIDLGAVFNEVHASNMTKMGSDGEPVVREDGKILKGPNYIRPDIRSVLFPE